MIQVKAEDLKYGRVPASELNVLKLGSLGLASASPALQKHSAALRVDTFADSISVGLSHPAQFPTGHAAIESQNLINCASWLIFTIESR